MAALELDLDTTGVVLVDLTPGLLSVEMGPHSADTVLANATQLAEAFRGGGATVVLTGPALPAPPNARAQGQAPPGIERDMSPLAKVMSVPNWSEIATAVGPKDGDIVIRKPTWSAFFGTDLDLQLRKRGVRTLVLCGIATNFGVESTARDARAYGYAIVLAEDAARAITAEEHEHSCAYTFPMMGRVRSTAEILAAVGQ
jgi:nicotinamidase-related amidase